MHMQCILPGAVKRCQTGCGLRPVALKPGDGPRVRSCFCKTAIAAPMGLGCVGDGDAVEVAQHQPIVIARDDHFDLGRESKRKHVVVIGIAAHRVCKWWRVDHLGKLSTACDLKCPKPD